MERVTEIVYLEKNEDKRNRKKSQIVTLFWRGKKSWTLKHTTHNKGIVQNKRKSKIPYTDYGAEYLEVQLRGLYWD